MCWLVASISLVVGVVLYFGWMGFPVPGSDSAAFLPPAVQWRAGEGLRNPVSEFSRTLDPTGKARYVQYPPLFPLAVALLMLEPTGPSALRAVAWLSGLNIGLAGILLFRVLSSRERCDGAALCMILLSVAGIATAGVAALGGRPEVLATTWSLLLALLLIGRGLDLPRLALGGVILGLLGATQPLAGLLMATVCAALISWRTRPRSAVLGTIALGCTSVAVFLLVLLASPNGLVPTLEGVIEHSRHAVLGRVSSASLWTYWIADPWLPAVALPFLLVIALSAGAISRLGFRPASPALFLVSAGAGALLVARNLWQAPEQSYNILFLAPLVVVANAGLASALSASAVSPWFTARIAALANGALAMGWLRAMALAATYIIAGTPLEQGRLLFSESTRGIDRIGVTASLWVLTEGYERLEVLALAAMPGAAQVDALLVQQNYSGAREAPELPGWHLSRDGFAREGPKLLGVPLGRTMPGYAFALYTRTKEESVGSTSSTESPG